MIRFQSRASRWAAGAGAVLLVAGLSAGCQKSETTTTTGDTTATTQQTGGAMDTGAAGGTAAQPLAAGHIEVQHVLVGFQGSVPGKNITRSQEDARKLANEILDRARKGEDFGQLVQQYTDDQFPGIYRLADHNVTAEQGVEYPRSGMVKGFGDAAFGLQPGQVGMAEFNTQTSPYGWHVIKRLR